MSARKDRGPYGFVASDFKGGHARCVTMRADQISKVEAWERLKSYSRRRYISLAGWRADHVYHGTKAKPTGVWCWRYGLTAPPR